MLIKNAKILIIIVMILSSLLSVEIVSAIDISTEISIPDTIYIYNPRKAQLTYNFSFTNNGPNKIRNLKVYFAIPEDRDNQSIKNLTFSKPYETKIDQYGQQVASIIINEISTGQKVDIFWQGEIETYSIDYNINPDQVLDLNHIPQDILSTYTTNGSYYNLDSHIIRDAAIEAAKGATNPYWIARNVHDYVANQISYLNDNSWDNAETVLLQRHGSCTEYAFLYVALCRANGIPARYVGGTRQRKEGRYIDDVYHRWSEVYLPPYGWIPVDVDHDDDDTGFGPVYDYFGASTNDRFATTLSGGGSDYLRWNYHSSFRYECDGSCPEIESDRYFIWEPSSSENPFDCSSVTDVSDSECEALVDLFQSTEGQEWVDKSNWLDSSKVEDWFGVTLYNNHVYGLDLQANNLTGSLPISIGNLAEITWLYLGDNEINGTLPQEMKNLKKLVYLFMENNQITGSIELLTELDNIEKISLTNNELTGEIPKDFDKLSHLDGLALNGNQFTGSLPKELGNIAKLEWLSVARNNISGSVPSELGQLSNLKTLAFSDTQLSGAIPMNFINLKNLELFYFYGTSLCEPTTSEFIAWKATVDDWQGTDIQCSPYKDQTFDDVSADHWAYGWIERIYNAGITGGCSVDPMNYCPTQPVTRAQMAILIERGINGPDFVPLTANGSVFEDVPKGSFADDWIEQYYEDGLTTGCKQVDDRLYYCPDSPVTRAQMAVFLLKAKYGGDYDPSRPVCNTGFSDVNNHWASCYIEQLVSEGITAGCGSGKFCPDDPVTRAQMAVFLVKTFELP
jgi:transglutaminase-like putative cysteine protease